MFKKILKFLKFIFVGAVWSYFLLSVSLFATIKIWNFNYLSYRSWKIINIFWNEGGSISQPKDYGLFFTLIMLIPLWLLGWRYLYKKNITAFLISPIVWYNKRSLAKYDKDIPRIVLKNMGNTQKVDPKEVIENKLKHIKTDIDNREKTSDHLREQLKEKISSGSLK